MLSIIIIIIITLLFLFNTPTPTNTPHHQKTHTNKQFLPQDKVVEFARLDARDLLVATEKAIGDAELHQQHVRLADLRNQAKTEAQVL